MSENLRDWGDEVKGDRGDAQAAADQTPQATVDTQAAVSDDTPPQTLPARDQKFWETIRDSMSK